MGLFSKAVAGASDDEKQKTADMVMRQSRKAADAGFSGRARELADDAAEIRRTIAEGTSYKPGHP